MSSPLISSLEKLSKIFYEYSEKEGNEYNMNRKELRILLQKELPVLREFTKSRQGMREMMDVVDENNDGLVDLQEFMGLVTMMIVDHNDYFMHVYEAGLNDEN